MAHRSNFGHWSRQRQLLGRRGSSLPRILKAVVGVYSAHPSGPLSLFARAKSFRQATYFDLEKNKRALRVPAMRLTVHLLPSETARKTVSATVPAPDDEFWRKRYSVKGRAIPEAKYGRWVSQVIDLTEAPRTVAEIKQGVTIPEETVKPVLNRMAFEGKLLRTGSPSLRSNAIRYVATEAWFAEHRLTGKDEAARIDRSLAWLAGEYLRGFGPARVKDFQWWAGVSATRAKRAFAELDTVPVADDSLLLAEDRKKFESFEKPRGDTLDLLPQWDCYTMGYAPDGRGRFVDADVQDRIYGSIGATGGNALGVVLVNGLASGAWSSRFKGTRMEILLDMFDAPSPRLKNRVRAEFESVASLLGAGEVAFDD